MNDHRVQLGQEVSSTNAEQTLESLDQVKIVVAVNASLHPTAATAGAVLLSLVSRLHAHVELAGDAEVGPNPWGVERLSEAAELFARVRPVASREPAKSIVIAIGDKTTADLYIGGDDWTVAVGAEPQNVEAGRSGLGLQAAATLTAAEIAKRCLGPLGMIQHPIGGCLVWNLADYMLKAAPNVEPPALEPLDIAFFAGGSVGSSAAGVVLCIPDLRGSAVVVDPDAFDPKRNPYRYPMLTGNEVEGKASWLTERLRGGGWDAVAHEGTVASWVRSQPAPGFDGIAVSSVDRVDSRLEVADTLARTTLSVGVAGLALHLQRELSFDEYACPFCQFASLAPPLSQVEVYAGITGLPVDRLAQLVMGDRLSRADLDIAIAAGKVSAATGEDLVGRRLEDLVRGAYAEATVQPSGAAPPIRVSAPYVSWMAGVLVGAELLKRAGGLPMIDRRLDLDLSGVPSGAVRRLARAPSGKCICSSPFRRRWAARLYEG